jgi:hypothetical protein
MPDKDAAPYRKDRTARERRKDLTPEQIREMELAGGVEGGMPAGSGGPENAPAEDSRDTERR